MRISIAMCTYNGEAYLNEQLESIAAQSVPPDELIVCDDGSKDRTLKMLREFAQAAPFAVKVIENPVNLGYTQNFNKAVQLCSCEMIALADQDDVWFPNKLATLRQRLGDAGVAGVFSNGELIDATSKPLGRTLWESFRFSAKDQVRFNAGDAVDVLLRRNVVTGMTLAIRSSMKPMLASVPPGWVHDWWLALQIAARSRIVAEPAKLVGYRAHGSQQLGTPITGKQKLSLIREHGPGVFLKSVRDRNLEEYELTAALFTQLAEFLRAEAGAGQELLAKVEAKVAYARRGVEMLNAPRSARLRMLAGNVESYRQFSPTGLRGLARDFALGKRKSDRILAGTRRARLTRVHSSETHADSETSNRENGSSENVDAVSIMAVIVLYKLRPSDSATLKTLLASADLLKAGSGSEQVRLRILVADNTPGGQLAEGLPPEVEYRAFPDNPGLTPVYNLAIKEAGEAFDWLLTLDQDTNLPPAFLASIAESASRYRDNVQVAAIVPRVFDGPRRVSPLRFINGFPRIVGPTVNGVLGPHALAVNSASLLRLSALKSVGGYDNRFPLNNSDTALFERLDRAGYRIALAGDVHVEHELAMTQRHNRMSLERYQQILTDERDFWDLHMSGMARAERMLRLMARLTKSYLRREDKGFRRVTRTELTYRLFTRRSERLRLAIKTG